MVTRTSKELPFQLPRPPYRDPFRRALLGLVHWPLGKILRINALNDVYARTGQHGDPQAWARSALGVLGVDVRVDDADLDRIPREGPVLLVSNHPFGALEGLILVSVLRGVRPDMRLMANMMLRLIPDLQETLIYVDPFGKADSARRNLAGVRACISHLESGGMLAMFPAGEVAHINLPQRAVVDPPWLDTAARIARRTKVPVIPMHISGQNGPWFQLAGLAHPRLRTIMLPHQLLNKKQREVRVRIGSPIPPKKFESFETEQQLTSYLRVRTMVLGRGSGGSKRMKRRRWLPAQTVLQRASQMEPIAEAADPQEVQAELAALPESSLLVESGDYQVMLVRKKQAPKVVHEIGRLREVTFREVGEGTGTAIDLDRFDDYYVHLVLWNRVKQELVGAYRMGPVAEILPRYGKDGLYTSTLFNFRPRLLGQLSRALELGRSFVRKEYQRSHSPLGMLWKGIGRFVCTNPQYSILFGPVSINNEYQTFSQQMIVTFLKANSYLPALGRLVKPKHAPRLRPPRGWDLRATSRVVTDIKEVSALISEIEADNKGVPILLKQYLRLDAKLLAFNVDPDFGYVLDGLMLVDLTRTDRRILDHFMGKQDAGDFLAYQEESALETPTLRRAWRRRRRSNRFEPNWPGE
jgi:putative hemolysin